MYAHELYIFSSFVFVLPLCGIKKVVKLSQLPCSFLNNNNMWVTFWFDTFCPTTDILSENEKGIIDGQTDRQTTNHTDSRYGYRKVLFKFLLEQSVPNMYPHADNKYH